MAYLNTIPVAADLLSISQGQILENFSQLETQFSIDHSSLLAGAATGKHTQVTLPEFATGVYPTTVAGEGSLFTEDDADTGQPELNYREESNGDVVKLTHGGYAWSFIKAFVYANSAGVDQGTPYNASVTRTAVGSYTITFATPMNDTNYTALITPESGAGRERAVDIGTKTVNDMTIKVYVSSSGSPTAVDCAINVMVLTLT